MLKSAKLLSLARTKRRDIPSLLFECLAFAESCRWWVYRYEAAARWLRLPMKVLISVSGIIFLDFNNPSM